MQEREWKTAKKIPITMEKKEDVDRRLREQEKKKLRTIETAQRQMGKNTDAKTEKMEQSKKRKKREIDG